MYNLGDGMKNQYVLLGGDQGAERLRLLNNSYWPTTEMLLRRIGVESASSFLDIGCGTGILAKLSAHQVR